MKTTKEMVEVMLAYDKGEQIEFYYRDRWVPCKNPSWDWQYIDYRVKPKYVPFESAEEFLLAQREHCDGLVSNDGDSWQFRDISVSIDGCVYARKPYQLSGYVRYLGDLKYLFENCKFVDGAPCGKEVKV